MPVNGLNPRFLIRLRVTAGRAPGAGRARGLGPFVQHVPGKWPTQFTIAGITKDGTGTPIASCQVELFRSSDDTKVATTLSDGAGAFLFYAGNRQFPFYLRAINSDGTLVGTTVETITGA